MSDNKSSDYLEGNYDGKNMVSLVGQIEADIKEAIVISQKAEKKKEEAEENEAKRILGKESVTEEDIDKILEDYATNEEYKQYLMDGAVLQCNQAMLEPFILPDGTRIDLVLNADENGEERKQTNLRILDESMSANDTLYATVLDTEKEENIFPFRCHCKKGVDREEEYTKIKNDPSCKTDGVCKHLMMLSNEWDNLPLEGQLYKKRDVTIKITDDLNLIMKDTQCINMMSMLFCKHGGLITPVTSGQSIEVMNLEIALDKMTQYLRGENISEEELNEIIAYVAGSCGLEVNEMIQGQFSEGTDKDAYNRSQMYDNQIIAWTYYWNKKIKNEFTYQFEITPNIVKAMIAQESSFGSDDINKARNPSRNVMQSLSTGNSTVWIASGINPYDNNMFSFGDSISYKMLDGTIGMDGSLPIDNLYKLTNKEFNKEREKMHFEDFDILKNIFEVDNNGKYMVVFENVTVNMSIATGVGLLAYKIEDNKDIYTGLEQYNTKGSYVAVINNHLEDMGAKKITK